MVGEEICGAVVSVRFQVSRSESWHMLPFGRAAENAICLPLPYMQFCRRTLSRYGTRQPATRPRQPGYATRYEGCSTYLPTPSWNIKHTPIASSTYGGRGGGLLQVACVLEQFNADHRNGENCSCASGLFGANSKTNSGDCCQCALKAKCLCHYCAVIRFVLF